MANTSKSISTLKQTKGEDWPYWVEINGTPVFINWVLLRPGQSFFLPCFQPAHLIRQLETRADHLDIRIATKRVMQGRVFGVRTWRLV